MRNALRAGWLLAAAILRKRKLGPLYSRKLVGGCWGTFKNLTASHVKHARLMGGTWGTMATYGEVMGGTLGTMATYGKLMGGSFSKKDPT